MSKANPPVKKFKVGRINITIWRNDSDKGPYHSVNFDRRYKTESGDWKTVTSFSPDDLPDLISAAEMARSSLLLVKRLEDAEEE